MQIVEKLVENNAKPVTSKVLALGLGVSERSVKTYIKEVSDFCDENGMKLERKPGIGFVANFTDEQIAQIEDMKKVCLLAFVLFTWSIVVNAQESDGRYVEVTGSSEIEVVPDEIHFLVQIKEYWQEEYTGKSKKEEDFHTKVPLAMIEKDLRKSLRKIGITDDAIRTQEIGDYWRQRGKEFLIGKQLDIRLTDFEQINSIIRSVNTWGIESMRIGELKHKDLPMYRKQGKIEALKAAREKASYLVEAMGQQLGEVIRIIDHADNNISRYLPFEAQSNVSMGAAATEQYRVIKLRYEMMARFAIK
mgnify:CR=1 FL=1